MNILNNFKCLLFRFYTFGVRRLCLKPKTLDPDLDPVQILTDPDSGGFSGPRTSMERLSQKSRNTNKKICKLSRIFIHW